MTENGHDRKASNYLKQLSNILENIPKAAIQLD